MSNIYLVRHGQAGTRDAYDSLSPLGCRQSRLLGEYFASQGIRFSAAYSGEMSRQQQSGEEVRAGYGADFPEIMVDPGWNEFDLDRMYREIAPQLSGGNPGFRREYEAMRQQVHASGGAQQASVHRRWLPCDTAVVDAWVEGGHDYAGESWEQFRQRVTACRLSSDLAPRDVNIAVFTSAVPIAIWTGVALEILNARVMKLAGVLHNASFTLLQVRKDNLRLFTFNATPHLDSPSLRTFR
ncbi:MAG TPA: histidine phosphatase family protein [Terriglobales bacterium]|nr:histidine phosphatase family protein [Terriglobales bacterium]